MIVFLRLDPDSSGTKTISLLPLPQLTLLSISKLPHATILYLFLYWLILTALPSVATGWCWRARTPGELHSSTIHLPSIWACGQYSSTRFFSISLMCILSHYIWLINAHTVLKFMTCWWLAKVDIGNRTLLLHMQILFDWHVGKEPSSGP